MTETLANGYSSESTHRELSNEYQHDWVSMVFRNLWVLMLWMKVALALEGLTWYTIWRPIDKLTYVSLICKSDSDLSHMMIQVNLDMTDHCMMDFCI